MEVFQETTHHNKYTSHAKKKKKGHIYFLVTQCKNSPYLSKVLQ